MTTIFWPQDVLHDGYFYGWSSSRTVCVAGVLDTDTVSFVNIPTLSDSPYTEQQADADTILAQAVCSEDVQTLVASPKHTGRGPKCIAARLLSCPVSRPKTETIPRIKPYRFIYYHRHATNSMRFYAADDDMPGLAPVHDDLKTPMEAFLAHDFTQNKNARLNVPEYKLIADQVRGRGKCVLFVLPERPQWNAAKSLQTAVEYSRARASNDSRHTGRKLARMHDGKSVHPRPSGKVSGTILKLREFSFVGLATDRRASEDVISTDQRKHVERNGPIAASSHLYNRHYNSVWVILNDVIIGLAFRQFVCQNREVLNAMVADGLESTLAYRIQRVLMWLDSWPAGLKLNTELSRFYSNGFMGLISQWTKLLHYGVSFMPAISFIVETTSLFGMTMTLSLFLDLVSVLTAHLYACYLVSSTIYRRILMLIGSLWNLFRGKRYNILGNRTDPWDYDVDQLLLGTILFTLAAHLFPTILVYYALFALLRLSLIVLYASCETLLAFMNHFPLFALMLRSKDPQRLPGNHPLPFAVVFAQYGRLLPFPLCMELEYLVAELWHRLSQHYHPIRLARRLLQGKVLDTFPHTSLN
ncbi:N-acetylglucosaminyl transferase component-domain-containing protein [Melanogaster broomeanus]|nr:N-acetylglucosaminyl transferase component-domain-containing protein [Melanogaster broomeanus]